MSTFMSVHPWVLQDVLSVGGYRGAVLPVFATGSTTAYQRLVTYFDDVPVPLHSLLSGPSSLWKNPSVPRQSPPPAVSFLPPNPIRLPPMGPSPLVSFAPPLAPPLPPPCPLKYKTC